MQAQGLFDFERAHRKQVLNGPVINGEIFVVKKSVENYNGFYRCNFRFDVDGESFSGAFDRISTPLRVKLLSAEYSPSNLWAAYGREDVVQFGRPKIRKELLFPWYENDVTVVEGKVAYDDREDSYSVQSITFGYEDDGKVLDTLQGCMKRTATATSEGKITYAMNWRFYPGSFDVNYARYVDTPFVGTINGKVTLKKGFVGNPNGIKMSYALDGENVTPMQVRNFIKWWLLCMVPFNQDFD